MVAFYRQTFFTLEEDIPVCTGSALKAMEDIKEANAQALRGWRKRESEMNIGLVRKQNRRRPMDYPRNKIIVTLVNKRTKETKKVCFLVRQEKFKHSTPQVSAKRVN